MFAVDTSNFTNINNQTIGMPLSFYTGTTLFILILGLNGNAMLLYISIRKNTLRLDPVSKLLTENLAATDIVLIFNTFLPCFITSCFGEWVLGERWCYIQAFLRRVAFINTILTVCSTSIFRLYKIRKTGAVIIQTRSVKVYLACMFLVSFLVALERALDPNNYVRLVPVNLSCDWATFDSPSLNWVIVSTIFIPVPVLISLICNIFIVAIILKPSNAGTNLRTGIVILYFCWAFILSDLALFAWKRMSDSGKFANFPIWKELIPYAAFAINTTINPVIFVLNNKKFRIFIKDIFKFKKPAIFAGTDSTDTITRIKLVFNIRPAVIANPVAQ